MREKQSKFTLVVLGCYFLFLLFLLVSGGIRKLINPKLSFLTIIALIIIGAMIVMNVHHLSERKEKSHHDHTHCECEHHHQTKTTWSSYLIFLPMILAVILPPEALGIKLQDNPNGLASSTLNSKFNTEPTSDSKEYTELDIGNILFGKDEALKRELTESKVYIIGKVLNSPKLKSGEMVVYRTVISCCAADGIPLGVVVKLPQKATFRNEEWVAVEGDLKLLTFDERLKEVQAIAYMVPPTKVYPVITATGIYRIESPTDVYLYP